MKMILLPVLALSAPLVAHAQASHPLLRRLDTADVVIVASGTTAAGIDTADVRTTAEIALRQAGWVIVPRYASTNGTVAVQIIASRGSDGSVICYMGIHVWRMLRLDTGGPAELASAWYDGGVLEPGLDPRDATRRLHDWEERQLRMLVNDRAWEKQRR